VILQRSFCVQLHMQACRHHVHRRPIWHCFSVLLWFLSCSALPKRIMCWIYLFLGVLFELVNWIFQVLENGVGIVHNWTCFWFNKNIYTATEHSFLPANHHIEKIRNFEQKTSPLDHNTNSDKILSVLYINVHDYLCRLVMYTCRHISVPGS
jgi:hypothetical protein